MIFEEVELRVRQELNDDDPANPVIDPIIMLKRLGDCYLNVTAVLGVSPSKNALTIANQSEVAAAAGQLHAIDKLLYSDGTVFEQDIPKMDYEFVLQMRGGRSAAQLTRARPRAFAAREIQGNTVRVYFDSVCPADATASLWSVAQATRPTRFTDTVYLAENGARALECMTIVACMAALTKEQMDKLGIPDTLMQYSQGIVDSILGMEKGRAAAIELPLRIVETEF